MTLCRRMGAERLAWALRRLHCPVARDALVLDVGSGGNPYPRANVLLDAYEETRERHWVPLKADRPAVLGRIENLPFRDGAFDFVIASHVLEHSADPARFLTELQRVARAGYIETPDAFMERLNPYRDHRLEVACRDGALEIRKKPSWMVDAELVAYYESSAKPAIAGGLIPRRPFAFHTRYYWEGRIPYTIINPEVDASWPAPPDAVEVRAPAVPVLRQALADTARRLFSQRARNRGIDLVALMRCPRCRGTHLQSASEGITCPDCTTRYPVRNGIPVMTARKGSPA